MCSIIGYYKLKNVEANSNFIKDGFDLMRHRGPDAENCMLVDDLVGLGHQRLSIIDLDQSANQPMESDKSVIVFNGEVYNYLELKADYLADCQFKTSSDTEVLQKGLEKFGVSFLNKTNGMFAFAYYDKTTKELVLARDRFGVKPLHYTVDNNIIYFSSEIKPLIKIKKGFSYNQEIIRSFFKDTATDYDEKTFINGINQVKPGHFITINSTAVKIEKWYYGNDFWFDKNIFKDQEQTIAFFEDLLVNAIKIRFRSDVPLCITLSGGLDSTSIYVLAKERLKTKIQPFIFSHPGAPTDESANAKRLAHDYGEEPIVVESKHEEGARALVEALSFLEFPIWEPSAIAYLDMYKAIKNRGFKVVVEGHGSDEQFGGYPYMIEAAWKEMALKGRLKFALLLYRVFKQTRDPCLIKVEKEETWLGDAWSMSKLLFRAVVKVVLSPRKFKYISFQRLLDDSFNYKILPIVLRTFDRLSMSQTIESRSPYMDFRLVEFVKALPLKYKVNQIGSKAILREILKKYGKDYIYKNRNKMGFASNLPAYFNVPENKEFIAKAIRDFDFVEFNQNKILAAKTITKNSIDWLDIAAFWKVAALGITKKMYERS